MAAAMASQSAGAPLAPPKTRSTAAAAGAGRARGAVPRGGGAGAARAAGGQEGGRPRLDDPDAVGHHVAVGQVAQLHRERATRVGREGAQLLPLRRGAVGVLVVLEVVGG